MTVLCEPNGLVAAALLADLGPEAKAVVSLNDAAAAMTADHDEHELILGPGLVVEEVFGFANWLRTQRPEGLALILMRPQVDGSTAATAASVGINEVIAADDRGALAAARTRALGQGLPLSAGEDGEDGEQDANLGDVVTVFSAKGGCGKTTLATNLAVTLAAGKAGRVCLVDLDLDFGDVAISLRLTPEHTLLDAAEVARQDRTGLPIDSLITPYEGGFDCILAPAEPGDGDRVSASLVTGLLDELRAHYDYIVVDTPSHFSEHVLAALDTTDYFVLVTTPELPSLKNLRLTLDMFDLLTYPREKRFIVFNRSDDQTGLTAADIERTVRAPITAHVPSSRDVPVSINKGVPIAQSNPRHPVSDAIKKFVNASIIQQPVDTQTRRFGRRKPVRN